MEKGVPLYRKRRKKIMRRIQKILLGTFLAGVLISGIGTGTAIAEYSSFTYYVFYISSDFV